MPLLGKLPSQPETCDQSTVSLYVLLSQIVEQSAAFADQHQQPSSAVVIMLVFTQMLGQMVDPLGHQRDLDLRRTGVTVVMSELFNDGLGVLHSHTRTTRGYEERQQCSTSRSHAYRPSIDFVRATSRPICSTS